MGYTMAEQTGLYYELERLGVVDFFDFEKYGERYGYDLVLFENGYIDNNEKEIDLDFYSKDEIKEKVEEIFEKYPIGSQEELGTRAKVIAKFFNPVGVGTWLITEASKLENNDYEMFGYCHLGDNEMAEFGYVYLSELEQLKLPFGMSVERDLYMSRDRDLITAMKQSGIKPHSYL